MEFKLCLPNLQSHKVNELMNECAEWQLEPLETHTIAEIQFCIFGPTFSVYKGRRKIHESNYYLVTLYGWSQE